MKTNIKTSLCFFAIIYLFPNIIAQNAPEADFTTEWSHHGMNFYGTTNFLQYSIVNLIDNSLYNPTAWEWTIIKEPDGNPIISYSQNITIEFYETGLYTVILEVTNSYGSDTEIRVEYIQIYAKSISIANIYTPNCSSVPDSYFADEYWDNSDILAMNSWYSLYWPNAVLLGPVSNTYNCHGYALHIKDGGSNVWIGYYNVGSEEIYWDENDGSYFECDANDPEVEIVSYFGDHSAITTDESGVLISKWQIGPLFKHAYNYCLFYNNDNFKYYKPAPNQGAGFTANTTSISTGESVQFTNESASTFTSFNWLFPGGTPNSSSQENPTVTYNSPGVYDVTLEAINGNCSKTETKTEYINVEEVLSASFTVSQDYIFPGNNVIVTNTSTGNATSWEWAFQGGLPGIITSENPPQEGIYYTSNLSPGTYTATLTISDGTVSDSYSLDIIVEESTAPLNANFNSNIQTVPQGSTVNFYDQSGGGPDTWEWDFDENGEIDSYSQNPANILFLEVGTFDIKLTVIRGTESDNLILHNYIEVVENSGNDLYADFEATDGTSVVIGEPVQFTDLTFGNPTYWHWTFEDATPSESWEQDPVVQFNEWGIQDVTLYVSNAFGEDEITYEDYISVFEQGTYIDFTIEPQGNNCYTLIDEVTLPGFAIPDIEWWVYDPYGLLLLHGDELNNFFCANEGYHTVILDVYDDDGYYVASVTKYFEVCTINHCNNGYQDCDETAIDCAGLECGSCGSSSDCNDCMKNGNETGIDCGGSCEPCQYSCTHVNKSYSNTNPPPLTHASETIVAGDGWVIIPNGDDVIFRAGNSVTLKSGFKAEEGSNFLAQTTPCYCVPICVFVPIVITPNDDGYNDDWCISVKGATTYELLIWNNGSYSFESSGNVQGELFCPWDFPEEPGTHTYFWKLDLWSECSGEPIQQQGSVAIIVEVKNILTGTQINKHNDLIVNVNPNPNKGAFNIHFSKPVVNFDMKIFNEIGDIILKERYQGSEARSVNISNYPKGIYYLKIKTDEKVFIEKIIKQ